MSDCWQIIESGPLSPELIMAKDAFLLRQLNQESSPLLHLYEWESPCLTYGYFIDPSSYLCGDALEHLGLQKARRPTGGGIIFHLSDFAFSVLIPAHHPRFSMNTVDNYAFINHKVAEMVIHFATESVKLDFLDQDQTLFDSEKECQAFCMANPTHYDLMIGNKKVGGSAQRRTKQGLLHQASLSLLFPPVDVLSQVLKNREIVTIMKDRSYCLLSEEATMKDLLEARIKLNALLKIFIQTL